jgi:hypothetical protein
MCQTPKPDAVTADGDETPDKPTKKRPPNGVNLPHIIPQITLTGVINSGNRIKNNR